MAMAGVEVAVRVAIVQPEVSASPSVSTVSTVVKLVSPSGYILATCWCSEYAGAGETDGRVVMKARKPTTGDCRDGAGGHACACTRGGRCGWLEAAEVAL